jgi:hypothetical protein
MAPVCGALSSGGRRRSLITSSIFAWGLRLLVIGTITLLCLLTDSVFPAIGFALTWIPNYPLFIAAAGGVLRLPRRLAKVHFIEPVLYRWAGVGLVKRIVTTRAWLLMVGLEAPEGQTTRRNQMERIELLTKGAEVVHGAAFVFAASMALLCVAIGGVPAAVWIAAFNLGLNGYPVMLQRSNRWRLQQIRAGRLRIVRGTTTSRCDLPPNNSLERSRER